MGVKIEHIDCDEIIKGANAIAKETNTMQQEIKKAYTEIGNMKENWKGNYYNLFIERAVNAAIDPLNKIFTTTVSDIPHEIAAKAKSYAEQEQITVSNFQDQTIVMLTKIDKTDPKDFKFMEDKVEGNKTNIQNHLKNAKQSAESAKAKAEGLKDSWNSLSGDSNIFEIVAAIKRLITIVETLEGSLTNFVKTQISSVAQKEKSNEAVEYAKEVVEGAIDAAGDALDDLGNQAKQFAADVWASFMF